MKILFISDVYFPRVNGVSTSIRTFVEQLEIFGHRVDLIAPDYGSANTSEPFVKRVAARQIYFDPEDHLMKYGEALKLIHDLKAVDYDLIHIHTPFVAHYLGLKLSRVLNIPCVETYHTFFEDYLHHYLPWMPQRIARLTARWVSKNQCNAVHAIVAPSQPMLDVLRSYGITTSAEVIPTGLQHHSFATADTDAFKLKYAISAKRQILLYVGRVAFEKNIVFLLRMMQLLVIKKPETMLIIAGEGPAEKSLRALTRTLHLENHVQFIGYLDRNTELNACYQSADVFVFASKSETQGLVLLEAMAQAKPVVAIAELGTASILVEGEGALIANDDLQDFANKVDALLSDSSYLKTLGIKAKQYVLQHWTAAVQAEKMAKFYEQVCKSYLAKPPKSVLMTEIKP